jgi:DNA gyrase subunit B
VVLASFIANANEQGALPTWHVKLAGREHWFRTQEEVDQFRREQVEKLGRDLVVADLDDDAQPTGAVELRLVVEEYHEIRSLNRLLQKLKEFGFGLADLVPPPRIAGREPPLRFALQHGESRNVLAHLRDAILEVRRIGERGLTITRFKGLGEMDPEELWATTLDPAKRTLMKVTLVDAERAHELFRTLMGEEVEKRRNFIFEKGINVKDNIDYGA